MKRLATVFTLSAFGGFVASEEFNPYQANDDYYDNYDYGYEDGFERSAEPSGPKSSPVTTSDVNQIYNSTSARNTTPCPSTPARQDGFAGQCAFESFADATDDFEEVTVDCHGNALPAGQKWYKAKNPFSGKENSFFHAPTGFNHWWDAYNFCHGDGMPAGSHMWCPTSEVESAWMWLHHPDQPFDPYGNDGSGTQGLWTGISTPYKRDPIYFCDLTRNSHTYFNWADSEPDQKLQKWVMLDFMSWKMVDLTRHTDNLGSFLCEVNCDILSTCEALNCANSDATCQDNGDVASSQCVCNDPAYEWDRASLSCVLINPVVNFNIPLESTAGMRSLLEEVLTAKGLQPVFDDIMDHGCHCVRIDRALSGLDSIDQNCQDWLAIRRCSTLLGGECHNYDMTPGLNFYSVDFNVDTNEIDCSSNSGSDQCIQDTCFIDAQYVSFVLGALDNDPNWVATAGSTGTCPKCNSCVPPAGCRGAAPNLEPVSWVDFNANGL